MDKESQELTKITAKILEDGKRLYDLNNYAVEVSAKLNARRAAVPSEKYINPLKPYPVKFNQTDNVNHPAHYTQGGIECIEALKAATIDKKGIEAVCVANIIKYLWRYEAKNGLEDVKKARFYLNYLIDELEKGADHGRKIND